MDLTGVMNCFIYLFYKVGWGGGSYGIIGFRVIVDPTDI